jgi:hypothetical protein
MSGCGPESGSRPTVKTELTADGLLLCPGNAIYRLCFRIFALNSGVPSIVVHWCPSLSAAIVIQLVTHAAFFSGMLSGGLSLIPQSLSKLFLGGRHGAGSPAA